LCSALSFYFFPQEARHGSNEWKAIAQLKRLLFLIKVAPWLMQFRSPRARFALLEERGIEAGVLIARRETVGWNYSTSFL